MDVCWFSVSQSVNLSESFWAISSSSDRQTVSQSSDVIVIYRHLYVDCRAFIIIICVFLIFYCSKIISQSVSQSVSHSEQAALSRWLIIIANYTVLIDWLTDVNSYNNQSTLVFMS